MRPSALGPTGLKARPFRIGFFAFVSFHGLAKLNAPGLRLRLTRPCVLPTRSAKPECVPQVCGTSPLRLVQLGLLGAQ